MRTEVFIDWQKRQDLEVIQTASSYWVDFGHGIFQAFPYHCQIIPSEEELRALFRQHRLLGLRYSAPWNSSSGVASYHVVYEKKAYSLSDISKKARHDVHRALTAGTVEPISFSRLAQEGWELRLETLERQGRLGAESRMWWQRLGQSADSLPGLETWGMIVAGRLAASLIAFTCEDTCSILYQQSLSDCLRLGVNNALTFVFTREVLQRPQVSQVFYGLHSLDAPASVDEYKFRMGFTARPVRQRVVFHPWFAPLVNPVTFGLLRILYYQSKSSPFFSKAFGLFRFYLQGYLPLEEQSWPAVLTRQKQAILGSTLS